MGDQASNHVTRPSLIIFHITKIGKFVATSSLAQKCIISTNDREKWNLPLAGIETNPQLLCATETELRRLIPNDLPKIMTINDFHYSSTYDKSNPPSQQETYQLIAKVLTTGDSSHWKPTEKPNNSWKNWESGHLWSQRKHGKNKLIRLLFSRKISLNKILFSTEVDWGLLNPLFSLASAILFL